MKHHLIKSGYRPNLNYMQCFYSLFYLHNQWAIIWTFIVKIPLSALLCMFCIQSMHSMQSIPFIVLFAACLIHTPVSVLYHMFMCVSPSVKLAWNRADYALIFVMILMTSYSLGYYPFYCNSRLHMIQMLTCGVPAILNIIWVLTPMYKHAFETRILRTVSSGLVIVLALFPVYYSINYYGIAAIVFYIIGAILWVMHLPEMIFPYVFDNNMNSHAWMHVCIVMSHLMFYGYIYEENKEIKTCGIVYKDILLL